MKIPHTCSTASAIHIQSLVQINGYDEPYAAFLSVVLERVIISKLLLLALEDTNKIALWDGGSGCMLRANAGHG